MIEREIDIQASGNRLAGTLCLPTEKGPFPMVLMVHGSGPLDRNQNMKGQNLDIFNTIAHHLAQAGIGSVRFDKRGCGSSEGDYFTAGHHDLVDDVVCWHDSLHRAEFCEPGHLFLLGHSEGCLVSAHATLRRSDIAGLVLLCPFVQPVEDTLMKQAHQIGREVAGKKGVDRLVHALVAWIGGGPVASQRRLIRKLKVTRKAALRGVPVKWLRELMNVDASQLFGRITCPMLLVGGEKDLQCDPADVARIAALVQGPVEHRVLADMTHLLRRDDQPPTLLGSQHLLTRSVDAELLEVVADWLRSRAAAADEVGLPSTGGEGHPP